METAVILKEEIVVLMSVTFFHYHIKHQTKVYNESRLGSLASPKLRGSVFALYLSK
jgi:hypothetical protein